MHVSLVTVLVLVASVISPALSTPRCVFVPPNVALSAYLFIAFQEMPKMLLAIPADKLAASLLKRAAAVNVLTSCVQRYIFFK